MEIFFGIIIFILGLCVGSFVNMMVHRVAVNYKLESLKFKVKSKDRSYCDGCGKQLNWYENIPVISWLIQKGKTRCCGKNLPVSYPIVELLMGFLFLIFYIVETPSGASLQLLLGLIIITFLVFSAVFDLKYMILPDFSTGILIGCSVILLLLGRHIGLPLQYLLSAAGGSLFLLILYLITKGKGMGMGDVKLALFMGLFLGFPKTITAFYVAFITGAIVGVVLILLKKKDRKSAIAFGPFLILGTLIAKLI